MKLNWKKITETEIEAKTCMESAYRIIYCDGKTFTSDARFIPNGYFKLTFETSCLKPQELFISPAEDGIDVVKQKALEDFNVRVAPYKGKRRIEIGRNGGFWVEFDYEFGEHDEKDVWKIVDDVIDKVNKLIEANGINAHFDSWDDDSENIGFKKLNANGEVESDWDCIDIYSAREITRIKTNEELGIEDLK